MWLDVSHVSSFRLWQSVAEEHLFSKKTFVGKQIVCRFCSRYMRPLNLYEVLH